MLNFVNNLMSLVIQDYVNKSITMAVLGLCIAVFLICSSIITYKYAMRRLKKYSDGNKFDNSGNEILVLILMVPNFFALIFIAVTIENLINACYPYAAILNM
jgi:heme/copper-type cytochrome/quinol oxidase subunit 2